MRPSSVEEALRSLRSSRFTVERGTIQAPPGRDPDRLSEREADLVTFLCEEHHYSYSNAPTPRAEAKAIFFGWLDAEVKLALLGFRYAKQGEDILIVPPEHIRMSGWIEDAVNYLCVEWGYRI